jgi:hypothetical protein
MKIQIETITPEVAAKYIKKIDPSHQRKLMPSIVDKYARSMRAGHWVISTDSAGFDVKGRCINGMHRLYGVVKSGRTIQMPVFYDLPEETNGIRTLDVLDTRKGRTVAQQINMNSKWSGKGHLVAAACRSLAIAIIRGHFQNTTPISLGLLDLYGDELEFCVQHSQPIPRLCVGPLLAGFVLAMSYKPKRKLFEEMYISTMTGEDLKSGSPALTLRNQMIMGKIKQPHVVTGGTSHGLRIVCGVTLAAMHYLNNKKVDSLRYSDMGLDFFRSKQLERVDKVKRLCGVL